MTVTQLQLAEQAKALNVQEGVGLDALIASLKGPPPPPPTSGLRVGIVGLEHLSLANRVLLSVKRSRIDVNYGGNFAERLALVRKQAAEGIVPYLLYNPGDPGARIHGLSKERIQGDMRSIAQVAIETGESEVEFTNEPYEAQPTGILQPGELAQAYAWAHEITSAAGITLVCPTWINTFDKLGNTWSFAASGGGWTGMIAKALAAIPGAPKLPDGWSFHPYGLMTSNGYGNEGPPPIGRPGWLTWKRLLEDMHKFGTFAPLYLSEVGRPVTTGSDGIPGVGEAQQAVDIRQMVVDAAASPDVKLLMIYADKDDGFGGYGLFANGAPRPAAMALGEAVRAAGVAGV